MAKKKLTKKEKYKNIVFDLVEIRKKRKLTQEEEGEYAEKLDDLWRPMSKKDKQEIEKWFKEDLRDNIPSEGPQGIKHLIECHCTLPQYKKRKDRIFHKFITFSEIDENGSVIPKFVQCNNCGIVHYVIEIGKSEFVPKDEFPSILTIEDIKYSISRDLREILDDHRCELPTWEEVAFLYKNKMWGSRVILSSDESENLVNNKVLILEDQNQFQIETITNQSMIDQKFGE